MPQDQLREAVEALRTRVQLELDAQLGTLSEQQSVAIEAARRAAEADAEQRWAAKVELVRAEWTARLESEVLAARSETERRMVAEAMRLRVEAEQAAAHAAARVREELELAREEERQRGATEVAAARDAAKRELEAARESAERKLEAARETAAREVAAERDTGTRALAAERDAAARTLAAEREQAKAVQREREDLRGAVEREREQSRALTEKTRQAQVAALEKARAAQRQVQLETVERILGAVRAMSTAGSLSDALTALLNGASAEAPRVALFLVNGTALQGWRSSGFTGPSPASVQMSFDECPLFTEALRSGEPAAVADGDASAAPGFAALPFHAEALAFPIVLGGETVAMLYADSGEDAGRDVPPTWRETLQILSRHASACLAHLTAVRTAQALRRGRGVESSEDDENDARRYARLLVSEIKLYNEPAVNIGRQNRDLLQRLRPEIERARRLYEERVPSALHARGSYFQQELVQTLADGDPALLGGEAVAH